MISFTAATLTAQVKDAIERAEPLEVLFIHASIWELLRCQRGGDVGGIQAMARAHRVTLLTGEARD